MSRYLVFAEAAEYLRCSRRTLTELLKQTDIPRYRLGGKYLFAPEELDRWLGQNPNVRLTKPRRGLVGSTARVLAQAAAADPGGAQT